MMDKKVRERSNNENVEDTAATTYNSTISGNSNSSFQLPKRMFIVAGTYDGVLAGWELVQETDGTTIKHRRKHNDSTNSDKVKLKLAFASPVHSGSIRALSIAAVGTTSPTTIPSKLPMRKKKSSSSINNDGTSTKSGREISDKTKQECDQEAQQDHLLSSSSLQQGQTQQLIGSLLSCGYDEVLRIHDLSKRITSSGEIKTPTDFGTPVCSSFAPPLHTAASVHQFTTITSSSSSTNLSSTHCVVGFTNGNIVLYKKRDWVIQHVLAGHEGGVSTLAVHPTGKLALSGGVSDGKLKLWDLTKGRLAFVSKINKNVQRYDPIDSIVWNSDGTSYGLSYGSHITVRDVATGHDVLDVELPSRVNQIAILNGPDGMFVAAACNDGSLPVLETGTINGGKIDRNARERKAIMAIEPVDGPIAGEERFRCIVPVYGYYVVTANSAGVVSLMNLQGAVNMIVSENQYDDDNEQQRINDNPTNIDDDNEDEEEIDDYDDDDEEDDGDKEEEEDGDENDQLDEDEEVAVDIIDSVLLGSGARITTLALWCACDSKVDNCCIVDEDKRIDIEDYDDEDQEIQTNEELFQKKRKHEVTFDNNKMVGNTKKPSTQQNQRGRIIAASITDPDKLAKARALVSKAKKIQEKQKKALSGQKNATNR